MPSTEHKPFYQFTIENTVVDVGLRLAVAEAVPDELDVRVDNVSDRKVKVYASGKKESVERFYKNLKTKKLGLAKNYTFSEIKPVEAAGCMTINTERFFHKLQCEQLGKFVEIGQTGFNNLDDRLENVNNELEKISTKLEELPKALAKELSNYIK
jgi:acylphosphatase